MRNLSLLNILNIKNYVMSQNKFIIVMKLQIRQCSAQVNEGQTFRDLFFFLIKLHKVCLLRQTLMRYIDDEIH